MVRRLPYKVPVVVPLLYTSKVIDRLEMLPIFASFGVVTLIMTPYLLLPPGLDMEALIPVLLPSAFQEPSVGYQTFDALALQPLTVALIVAMAYTFLKNSLPAVAVLGRVVPY